MRPMVVIIVCVLTYTTALAQKQGIKGQVFWVNGNQMPGPDKNKPVPQQGIAREIYIYNAVTLNHVQREGAFFNHVDAILIAKIQSQPDGTFKIKLPPGRYSILTKENQGLFANLFDGQGCINCVDVVRKRYSWITITLDYEAAY